MDGDGVMDAVCAGNSNASASSPASLYVLRGDGNGTFDLSPEAAVPYGHATSQYGSAALMQVDRVGDVNGDGIPDLLGYGADGWTVMLGEGGLQFQHARHYAIGFLPFFTHASGLSPAYSLTDINGDGILDIVATGPNGIYITSGLSDGSFATGTTIPVSTLGSVVIADFNEDGIPDIAGVGAAILSVSLVAISRL